MNCRTCKRYISECLDGRLPSGRRKAVMGHLLHCASCAEHRVGLQRAQDLVLQLPRHRVGPGFREQLFQRIDAGEGTPSAVFHEPIPLARKVRYVLSGAAAAAAVLAVATLVRRDAARSEPAHERIAAIVGGEQPRHAGQDAGQDGGAGASEPRTGPRTDPVRDPQAGLQSRQVDHAVRPVAHEPVAHEPVAHGWEWRLDPIEDNVIFGATRPVTPEVVAMEAARQIQRRYDWTRRATQDLEASHADSYPAAVVCEQAREIVPCGEVLLDLWNEEVIRFDDPEVGLELRFVVNRLRAERERLRMRDLDTVRTVVAPALHGARQLAQIERQIWVQPHAARAFTAWDLYRRWPTAYPLMFVPMPMPDGRSVLGFSVPGRVILLQGACEPQFVTLRSRVDELSSKFRIHLRLLHDTAAGAAGR